MRACPCCDKSIGNPEIKPSTGCWLVLCQACGNELEVRPTRSHVALTPGQLLQTIRVLQETTQVALAKRMHVTRAVVAHLEAGRMKLTPLLARRAAKALKIAPEVLFHG